MARDPLGERWPEVYGETPEVFARFSDAEDQDSLIPAHLIELANLSGQEVLEIGSGTGRWTRQLAPHARRWIATEPQEGMLTIGAEQETANTQWMRARGQQMPFASQSSPRIFAAFVFANLRPKTREKVVRESQRLVAPGGELWLLENHWEDQFQELRRNSGLEVSREIEPLVATFSFEHVTTLETRMEFESHASALETLGTILGPRVTEYLSEHPQRTFTHRVCLLRWTAN
jgi:ubiquinone/menaquinone biosynthesis C-methylase UbiE